MSRRGSVSWLCTLVIHLQHQLLLHSRSVTADRLFARGQHIHLRVPPLLTLPLQFFIWQNTSNNLLFGRPFVQEGQHPLTGQRAANFRLLASQWAERRLVTQWCHDCHAMRRSVCNAGASNAGRSLCVQISRERSYRQPIYCYHSKGNWLR